MAYLVDELRSAVGLTRKVKEESMHPSDSTSLEQITPFMNLMSTKEIRNLRLFSIPIRTSILEQEPVISPMRLSYQSVNLDDPYLPITMSSRPPNRIHCSKLRDQRLLHKPFRASRHAFSPRCPRLNPHRWTRVTRMTALTLKSRAMSLLLLLRTRW
jgi:hypothetical protein